MERVPTDLNKVLGSDSKAKAKWKDLTPIARRDFISWINEAKRPETRKRRVESIPSRLASGKRRPCCYALVPLDLYKVIGANPKAKTTWKELSPDERRDFTDWINEAKKPSSHQRRIEKTCALLAKGKKRP